jgi:hypothetical protein
MVGARKFGRPPIYKTTNGGINWGYQFPDTTLQLYSIGFIQFVNNRVGWIYPSSLFGASLSHTTTGGNDTTFFTGIKLVPNIVPEKFSLGQNYPNPFNSMCNVKFSMCNAGNVKLLVYDVQGREVQTLVNESLKPGTYEVSFDGSRLNSGVYFYRLVTDGYRETKKMIMIK